MQTIAERERLFKEAEEEKEREKQRREVRAVSCHYKHMYHLWCMLLKRFATALRFWLLCVLAMLPLACTRLS